MRSSSLPELAVHPEILADLGLEEPPPPLGAGGAPGDRLACAGATDPEPLDGEALASELGPRALLALSLPGAHGDARLAAWRNALWPDLHVVAIYASGPAGLVRRTHSARERLDARPQEPGALLVARRREHVLSPEATVEKFDQNASGWNGAPGAAGYLHFRWMRRHVAHFEPTAPGGRVLDFGCGAGWVGIEAALAFRAAELCAFDPSPEMVRIAGENARGEGVARFTGRTGFGEDPPFPAPGEEPFDLVISSGVISFAPDAERWLDGLARTLRPGGTLVVGDIHPGSRGMRARRRARPLLPVRELNARRREEVVAGLERRGFRPRASGGYQLTWPMPQALHLDETRLRGLLARPLLLANRGAAALDRALGGRAQDQFDSWVASFSREA